MAAICPTNELSNYSTDYYDCYKYYNYTCYKYYYYCYSCPPAATGYQEIPMSLPSSKCAPVPLAPRSGHAGAVRQPIRNKKTQITSQPRSSAPCCCGLVGRMSITIITTNIIFIIQNYRDCWIASARPSLENGLRSTCGDVPRAATSRKYERRRPHMKQESCYYNFCYY